MTDTDYAKGLEGVIAAESEICQIDGPNGKLYYRGYSIEDLAQHSSFEEATYLLLFDKLPSKQELADFASRMRQSRELQPAVQDMIRQFPPAGSPMELLQSVVSYLSSTVEHQIHHSDTCNCRRRIARGRMTYAPNRGPNVVVRCGMATGQSGRICVKSLIT